MKLKQALDIGKFQYTESDEGFEKITHCGKECVCEGLVFGSIQFTKCEMCGTSVTYKCAIDEAFINLPKINYKLLHWVEYSDGKHYVTVGNKAPWNNFHIRLPKFVCKILNHLF